MKNLSILLLLALSVAVFGCGGDKDVEEAKAPAGAQTEVAAGSKTLAIEWHRMVDKDGNVCCGGDAARMEVETARAKLAEELEGSGIEVVLAKTDHSPEECMDCPECANCIMVAGKGINQWLDAEMTGSPCGGVCKKAMGDNFECQNLVYEGKTYDVIPADLIVKAGLLAAADPANLISATCGASAGCPSAGTCPYMETQSSGPCGKCPASMGSGSGCPSTGSSSGTYKVDDKMDDKADDKVDDETTKASSCPNSKTCGNKSCTVGG